MLFHKFCVLNVIPQKNIAIFYYKKENLVIFKSTNRKKFLFVNQKLNLLVIKNKILFIVTSSKKFAKNETKLLNSTKKLTLNYFKQHLIEMELTILTKLNLIGVGFKVFKTNYDNILMFKLGFSHPIYFKLSSRVEILKHIKLLFKSMSYYKNKELVAKIRSLKFPEPYKGKGIFYNKEKVCLKEGKKT